MVSSFDALVPRMKYQVIGGRRSHPPVSMSYLCCATMLGKRASAF